jgi:hypothetical protein
MRTANQGPKSSEILRCSIKVSDRNVIWDFARLVLHEISRFLRGKEPSVLCVRGKWGVGKTYAWKAMLEKATAEPDGIGLERYAYVSVFGINSLEELKYAICAFFERSGQCCHHRSRSSEPSCRSALH